MDGAPTCTIYPRLEWRLSNLRKLRSGVQYLGLLKVASAGCFYYSVGYRRLPPAERRYRRIYLPKYNSLMTVDDFFYYTTYIKACRHRPHHYDAAWRSCVEEITGWQL